VFWSLERVAPALGARWAERIWFTLPRRRTEANTPTFAVPSGQPFETTVDSHVVRGERWGSGPAVYLLHGWAGNRGQLTPFVAPLVAAGFTAVALDAPSHGASDPGAYGPRSSSIPEFAGALTAAAAVHGPAHAVVAHSMGATAAAVALSDGLPAKRVVMLAPMASPMSYARQFAKVLGFGDRTLSRMVARIERRVGAPVHHFDVPELGRAIAMPPALILHDRDDASTSVTDGAAIAAAWPSAQLRVTSGLGHRRILRDPGVVTEVIDFVTG
jgi:pimeloyl-ACP methyl ester carboxylesterase